ncbi:hypothetical protein [Pelagibaculum spongiae]|uniref:Capsule biosynthesis protein n=1 Tax=Pelagibaculum spongiae TaxID=2080658 RepID=A0A2V1H1J6_9GAMM|nr:hypothetical protein [Pelagibaculum spongiae]PVZ70251.1 hypothetical protein DC094_06530 [Pelagibaculum spongiae]
MKAIPDSISRKAKKLVKKPDAFVKDMKLLRWVKSVLVSRDFNWLVIFPFMIATAYMVGVASNRYASNSSFIVQSASGASTASAGLALLGLGDNSAKDEQVIVEYIQSLDLLKQLDQQLQLKAHYSSSKNDLLYRLEKTATQEDFLKYYRNNIKIHFDESRGMLLLEAETFDAEYSEKLVRQILRAAEGFVNKTSHDLANGQQQFVAEQVLRLEQKLRSIKQSILIFQENNQLYSPEAQGSSLGSIVSGLEAKLSELKARRRELLSYQKPSAPAPMSIARRISSIEIQIDEEKLKLVSNDGNSLNQRMAEYQQLRLDLEFATRAYESSLAALEAARMEASRKLKHLVTISKPQIAEEAAYPRKLYILFTLLLCQLMLFSLYRMIRATIREHQD